jgi:leader peptidase (prepilin peptidase)/N-methyltransferase
MKMTFLKIYIDIIAFVLGTVFGSFINCMAWRIVHHESVLKGRSHCAVCGHALGPADLVPVFSYLFLRGRCRYCGEKISPRYMIVELLTGLAFLGIVLRYPLNPEAVRWCGFSVALMGLSLVDLDIQEIPDRFIVFSIIWWAATLPLMNRGILFQLEDGLIGGAVIGIGILVLSLIFDRVTGKESLGGGDIKLLFVTGLYFGPWTGLFHLILSCFAGLVCVALMKQKKIPFGPAISAAAYVCMLWGEDFTNWYFGLIGV